MEMEDAPMADSYTDMDMAQGAVDLYSADVVEHVMRDNPDESIEVEMDTATTELIEYDMADEVAQEQAPIVVPSADDSIIPDPPSSPFRSRTPEPAKVSEDVIHPDTLQKALGANANPQTEPSAQEEAPRLESSIALPRRTPSPILSTQPLASNETPVPKEPSTDEGPVAAPEDAPQPDPAPTTESDTKDAVPSAGEASEEVPANQSDTNEEYEDQPSSAAQVVPSSGADTLTAEPPAHRPSQEPQEPQADPSSRTTEPQASELVTPVFVSNPSSSSLSSFYLFSIPSGDADESSSSVVLFDDQTNLFHEPLERIFGNLRALGEEVGIQRHTELSLTCESLDLTITEASGSLLALRFFLQLI